MWPQVGALLAGVALGLWLMADDNMDPESLRGKRVIVTGASSGIGEQLAYVYAQHGAVLVITARRQAHLNRVVEKCRTLSPSNASHIAIPADMKDSKSIQNLIRTAVRHMGGVDIVVLNHITKSNMAVFTGSQSELDNAFSTMDVNYKSYVQMAALALPHLTESEGGLVIVNSLMGTLRSPTLAGYSASKFALHGFFGSLRSQFIMEQRNVAITMCVLGFIDTQNAMDGLREAEANRILKFVRPVSAAATAHAIAAGSARRDQVVYYPSLNNQLMLWLHSLWPSASEYILREMARY